MLDVLEFLTRSKPVGTYAKDLLRSCSIALPQLMRAKPDSWSLKMAPWTFELVGPRYRGQENCTKIVMGAELHARQGELAQQSIPVSVIVKPQCFSHGPPWCKHPAGQDGEAATRRLHFDYDANVSKWPKHHLQIGGNPQELREAGTFYVAVSEDPSEPRVPTPSLDLVLALDLVMREFDTGLDLPQDSGWRSLVISSEEISLKPYFSRVHNELQRQGRDVPVIEHLSQ
jgi:hypothetical protein